MKQYKLIKKYPGSPKLGELAQQSLNKLYYEVDCLGDFTNTEIENYPEFWEEIKDKEWEILSFKRIKESGITTGSKGDVYNIKDSGRYSVDNSRGYNLENMLYIPECVSSGHFEIYSVKRLSDGEVFTIGDKINHNTIIETITKFTIDNQMLGGLEISTIDGNKDKGSLSTSILKKYKIPLFTTEDGVDIYMGDRYYWVNIDEWYVDNFKASEGSGKNEKNIPFSTKEKAEEYILMNKPCLSLLNLFKKFYPKDFDPYDKNSSACEDINTTSLIALAKKKLQQRVR